MPDGDGDPAFEQFDDEEWQTQEDPFELVKAREKLDTYLAAGGNDGVCSRCWECVCACRVISLCRIDF
jgi:hypothetical protein